MRKLLFCVFVVVMSVSTIYSQESSKKWYEGIVSYKYNKYGVINKNTNGMVLEVDDRLSISKKDDLFTIQISDPISGEVPIYSLMNISLKGYDELNEKYVYVGDAIEIVSKEESGLIYKGKCLINSFNKLDVYLNNKGYNYENTYNNNFSFSVYFRNMQTTKEGYIPRIPDSSIKIFPIKNKVE
ncbi:MAG: hypothetical protein ACK5KL_04275 [Dysgonomonas sp.]